MAETSIFHILGMAATLLCIVAIGVNSGKRVKNEADFSTGGNKSGIRLMTGALIGTLIGGSSTIGTAQLAFNYGLSAWWFTLGTGLGCLLFGLIYVKPLRHSNIVTIQEAISREYGQLCGTITSILNSLGLVLNIISQFLSANALLSAVFGLSSVFCAVITVIIMISYVTFGGVIGAGILGNVKLVLTYFAITFGMYKIWSLTGFGPIFELPSNLYFNIFARGVGKDLGSMIAVVLGVICGQTYVQIVLSGKKDTEAVNAAVLSALLLPPVGLGSVFIGMFMKANYPFIESGQAFPLFVINHMNPIIGGAILATLLLALIGTGSGMALGFGTVMTKDIYKKFVNKDISSKSELAVNRAFIVFAIMAAGVFTIFNTKTDILTWGFMATGLRGMVLLFPMMGSLFFQNKIDYRFAIASSIVGFAFYTVGNVFVEYKIDPIFIGVASGLLIFTAGFFVKLYANNVIKLK